MPSHRIPRPIFRSAPPPWEWSFHMLHALMLVVSSPSGSSNLFHLLLVATILKEGTTVVRGLLGFGSLAINLSESTQARTCWWGRSIEGESTHAPAACYVSHPCHVCHALKKFTKKALVALQKSAKFVKVFSLESFSIYNIQKSAHIAQALQIGISHCLQAWRCGETGLYTLEGTNYTTAQWFTLVQGA